MRAQIFYSEKGEKLENIKEALNQYFGLEVESIPVLDKDKVEGTEGKDFLDLIRSGSISAETIKVAVQRQEDYVYLGGDRGDAALRLLRGSRDKVLPAVAVMGRMVMAPRQIESAFEPKWRFMFRTLDLRGIRQVDFDDGNETENAIRIVAEQIGDEVVRLGRRHMLMTNTSRFDLKEFGKLLGMDENDKKAERYLKNLEKRIVSAPVQLAIQSVANPKSGGQYSVEVRVNCGSVKPGSVGFRLRAPAKVPLHPKTGKLSFDDKQSLNGDVIKFTVTSPAPYCPIELTLEPERDDFRDQWIRIPFVLADKPVWQTHQG